MTLIYAPLVAALRVLRAQLCPGKRAQSTRATKAECWGIRGLKKDGFRHLMQSRVIKGFLVRHVRALVHPKVAALITTDQTPTDPTRAVSLLMSS